MIKLLIVEERGIKMKKCDKCKKNISEVIQRADGLPNDVSYELEDGTVITLCSDYIIEFVSRDKKGQEDFFKELSV